MQNEIDQSMSRMVASNQYSSMGYSTQNYNPCMQPCQPCIPCQPIQYQPYQQQPPCPPCPPCEQDLVQPRPIVEKPAPKSRVQYRPIERSIVEYQVRQRTEQRPIQRTVTQFREQKRKRMVPKEKVITQFYAIQKIKQFVPQYKQQVVVQQVPAQKISYKQQIVQLGTRQKVIKPEQKPQLFSTHKEHVADIKKGKWKRIEKNQIKSNAKWVRGEGEYQGGTYKDVRQVEGGMYGNYDGNTGANQKYSYNYSSTQGNTDNKQIGSSYGEKGLGGKTGMGGYGGQTGGYSGQSGMAQMGGYSGNEKTGGYSGSGQMGGYSGSGQMGGYSGGQGGYSGGQTGGFSGGQTGNYKYESKGQVYIFDQEYSYKVNSPQTGYEYLSKGKQFFDA